MKIKDYLHFSISRRGMINKEFSAIFFSDADMEEKKKMLRPVCDIKGPGTATLTFSYDRTENAIYWLYVYVDGKRIGIHDPSSLPFYNRDIHYHNRRLENLEFKESLLIFVFTNNNTYDSPYGFFDVDVKLYEEEIEPIPERKKHVWVQTLVNPDDGESCNSYLELRFTRDKSDQDFQEGDELYIHCLFKPWNYYEIPIGMKLDPEDTFITAINNKTVLFPSDVDFYSYEFTSTGELRVYINTSFTDGMGAVTILSSDGTKIHVNLKLDK